MISFIGSQEVQKVFARVSVNTAILAALERNPFQAGPEPPLSTKRNPLHIAYIPSCTF
jgi:hypothetical protein